MNALNADFKPFTSPNDGLLTSLDGEPSCIIDGHVNVISGGFVDHSVDMVIPGPEPLQITRTWNQSTTHALRQTAGEMKIYWAFESLKHVEFFDADKSEFGKQSYVAIYKDATGQPLHFLFQGAEKDKRNRTMMWQKMLKNGVTNSSSGVIGASSNIRNAECTWKPKEKACDIIAEDGTKLHFANLSDNNFQFISEEKPNSLQVYKEYQKKLFKTALKNVNGVKLATHELHIDTDPKPGRYWLQYVSNDGRVLEYEAIKAKLENRDKNKDPWLQYGNLYGTDYDTALQVSRVKRPNAPEVRYEYYQGHIHRNHKNTLKSTIEWPKISKILLPKGRDLEVFYYRKDDVDVSSSKFCKVKELKAPVGAGPEMQTKYRFRYHVPHGGKEGGITGVINARGFLTNYAFNSHFRLSDITKCQEGESPYTIESLFWGQKGTPNEMELQRRTFGSAHSPHKIFCKNYIYDGEGNAVEEQLWGNLTGKHDNAFAVNDKGMPIGGDCDLFAIRKAYNGAPFRMLKQSIEEKVKTEYVYQHGTNLLVATYKSDDLGVFERHFYHNDQNGQEEWHVIDDGKGRELFNLSGVTFRKIIRTSRSTSFPYGLPLVVSEYYVDLASNEDKLLFEKRNTFDKLGRLTIQETYDSNRDLFATETWEYDRHGNCLVHTNPLGDQVRSSYDENDNKITEQGPNPELTKRFYYDYMNRLIKVEEQHPDVVLSKHFKYDLCGNQIASIDVYGKETCFEFDAFNRPIKVVAPLVQNAEGDWIKPITKYGYDEMGNISSITDPEGNVTRFKHTLYKKPYHISYPDGSEERFEYDLQGNLVKEIAKNGSETHYTLDAQSRIVHKQMISKTGELLMETRAVYDSFHLLSETDAMGNLTTYSYDSSGRVHTVTKGERVTRYQYDSMGRVSKTIEGNSVKVSLKDSLNREIEMRVELLDGTVLSAARFAYDAEGHQIMQEIETPEGFSVTNTKYDTHGVPVQTINPLGYITYCRQRFDYVAENGGRTLCLETIDALGQKSLSVQDALGRLVLEHKFNTVGELLQESRHFYNSSDKRVKTMHKVMADGEEQRIVTNQFVHDNMRRLVLLVQAAGSPDEKRFTIQYNQYGEKETYTKPDGVALKYSYDDLGRLSRFFSTDQSVDYEYSYDQLSNPIRVEDHVLNRATTREYDRYGDVVSESLANGLTIESGFNLEGLIEKVTFPDSSVVRYTYEGPRLKSVMRLDSSGNEKYVHTYESYDAAGRLTSSSLAYGADQLKYQYDLCNAVTSIQGTRYWQKNQYDPLGNLIRKETMEGNSTYEYDQLNQLKNENGHFSHTYSHDSLYNRTSKDDRAHVINALNQILNDGESVYSYDLSGNLMKKTKSGSVTSFKYDALDRLVLLDVEGEETKFTFDENNRCLSIGDEKLLYVGQNDIGTIAKEGEVINLRILGSGLGAEIGAAIAVEVNETTYVPVHDHNGNVALLLNSNGSIQEQYEYSAFGEENAPSNSINPWRFASKRNVKGYLLFGRRFYNPELARWLTADPTGYESGPNLYAYLFNNPLTHFDAYGLFDEDTARPSWYSSFGDTLKTIGSGLQYAFTTNAQIVQQAYWHLDPMPMRKDIGMAIGYLAEHGSLSGYTMSWNRDKVDHDFKNDRPLFLDRYYLHYTNGMNNTFEEGKAQALKVSEYFDGCAYRLLHVPGRGTVSNLIDTIFDKCNILSETSRVATKSLMDAIDSAKSINPNAQVLSISFSQGGEVIFHGLEGLSAEDRALIHTRTLGSARFIQGMGQASYGNYASTRDPVPAIANLSYLPARMGFVSGVTFLPGPSGAFFDHAMDKAVYEESLYRIKDRMINKED
ncbi:MAG: RHS repeat-associated core domain-containing protein [Parachlamydiaceae bacterium]